MARAVVFDCFSGASGDMLLGALLDVGVELEALRAGLGSLPIAGWQLQAEPARQHGIGGTRARVRLDATDQPHRGLSEVLRIVRSGQLPAAVEQRAAAVFQRLGEVEARIHGTSVDQVEFHEVGAVDAIVDVVGVVLGLHLLGVDWERVCCEGLPLGSGWVSAAHGRLPVPAPATVELMRLAGMPVRRSPSDAETGELTTPTGAALLTVLARPSQRQSASDWSGAPPTFERPNPQSAPDGLEATGLGASNRQLVIDRLERVGYGFGTREPPWPNAVRLLVGAAREPRAVGDLLRDQVVEIQTNLDDASPEELGFAMERLLEAGALDVAFSPLQMKKNRPGVLVRVLARPADGQRLAELVLEHTSALGVRLQSIERLIARRAERSVRTPWGEVRVKIKQLGAREIVAPEYEDCARLAREANVPLRDVYDAARLHT